ncbi:MAG: hypothetical protein AAGN46_11745 [Acidobacteriota bacterium]
MATTLTCMLALAALSGCASPGSDPEVDQAQIETMLEEYLPVLGRAYGERDSALIERWAVPKEVARVKARIRELEERGQRYEPQFSTVAVESVSTWNYSNALVTTVEEWNVRSYPLGADEPLNEALGQRSRVKYQLKRKDDGWVVLFRELDATLE